MADISKITLLDGQEYDIKDAVARAAIPAAATATPQMDGSAAVGTSTKYAKEDHVHPTDTSLISLELTGTELVDGDNLNTIKTPGNYYFTGSGTIKSAPTTSKFKMIVIKTGVSNTGIDIGTPCQILFTDDGSNQSNGTVYYRYHNNGNFWRDWQSIRNPSTVNSHTVLSDVPANAVFTDTTYTPASNAPLMDGTVAVGTSEKYAREDHVHPTDTSLVSTGFTGTELVDGNNLAYIQTPGNYYFTGSGTIGGAPTTSKFKMVVIKTGKTEAGTDIGAPCQILFSYEGASSKIYYRYHQSGNLWRDWQSLTNILSNGSRTKLPTSGANLNDYKTPGTYSFASNGSITNSPLPDSSYAFTLFVIEGNNTYGHGCSQIIFPIDATVGATFTADIYFRRYSPNTSGTGWSDWVNLSSPTTVNGHTVLSDVPANAVFTDTTYTPASAAPGNVASSSSTGTSTNYARQDHTHGIDLATGDSNGQVKIAGQNISVKGLGSLAYADSVTTVNGHTVQSDVPANAVFTDTTYTPASADPLMDGTAAVGTSVKYAREDHVHPKDTSLFSLSIDGTEIPSGADLNSYTTPGNYYCRSVSIASTLLNCPIVTEFKMIVIRNKQTIDESCTQIIFPSIVFTSTVSATSGGIESGIFYRIYNPYVWYNWIGVNNRYILTSNDDIDNCTNPGIYHCQSNTYANTILNGPTTNKVFSVLVMEGVSSRTCQIGFVPSTGSIYFRFHSGATWTTWYDIRNASTVNGHTVESDVPANLAFNCLYYGECSTAAATVAKTVTLTNGDGFSLVEGAKICVKFEYANSASSPTLNVNDTGAKAIVRFGTTVIGTTAGGTGNWSNGGMVLFIYDGTSWVEHYWNNTTYSSMTVAEYTAGTATTGRLMTAARLKAAIKLHSAPDVYTATIPTTGWTTASYGAYIDVTFTGATFAAGDTVFVDLNLSSDTNLQLINDSWACLLRATPTASSAIIRFKFREVPTVEIPVRAVVK